jgi:tetratricopeptide (TPR) repeat protein
MIVGWRDPQSPSSTPALTVDFVQQAFGPKAEVVPPPSKEGLIKTNVDESIPARTSVDNFLSSPHLIPPLDAHLAELYLLIYETARAESSENLQRASVAAQMVAEIGFNSSADLRTWPQLDLMRIYAYRQQALALDPWYKDDRLPALAMLAARAAHRGAAAQPDDPMPYLMLARAYRGFATGSELRLMQQITALRQGLARVLPEQMNEPWMAQQVVDAYLHLSDVYWNNGRLDLGLECLKKHIENFRNHPPLTLNEEQRIQRMKELEQREKEYEKVLRPRQDNFDLFSSRSKNRSVLEKFDYASRQLGLFREALKVLEEAKSLDPLEGIHLALTNLELGQVEQAAHALDELDEKVGFDRLDPELQARYRNARMQIAACRGDFVRAGNEVEQQISLQERLFNEGFMFRQAASIVGALYLRDTTMVVPLSRIYMVFASLEPLFNLTRDEQQLIYLHSLYSLRAYLALEHGENVIAATNFEKAMQNGIQFVGRPAAERYLKLLQNEAKPR